MVNKRFIYDETQIISQIVDQTNNQLWLAFAQDASGNCALQKYSAFDPSQVYYDIDISVDSITKMFIDGSYLYLAYDDTNYIGAKYSINNPLTSNSTFNIPSGITEAPVDLLVSGSDLWYLLPGNATGINAKLIRLNTSGVYQETIDLIETGNIITGASSLTIEPNSNDLYVITNTSPSKLIRIYQMTGGSYDFEITSLTP